MPVEGVGVVEGELGVEDVESDRRESTGRSLSAAGAGFDVPAVEGVLPPGVAAVGVDSLPARRARCGLSSSSELAVSCPVDVITDTFLESFKCDGGVADGNTNVP